MPTAVAHGALGLLSVHPHPDDESIACGGVLARYAEEGLRVKVVTCTGGEEGENLAGIDLGDEAMLAIRARELSHALAALGLRDHELLGYRDSGMAGRSSNDHPDSFHRADLDEAGSRLAAIIRRFRPHVVVSDDERGTYGHPDHVKAYAVTTRAVQLAADAGIDIDGLPPWRVRKRYSHALPKSELVRFHDRLLSAGLASPFGDGRIEDAVEAPFGTDDELVTTRVDVRRWLGRKQAAMRAHRSQIGVDSFFLNLPEDLAAEAFGLECFVLEDGDGPPVTSEEDLFAGLRA